MVVTFGQVFLKAKDAKALFGVIFRNRFKRLLMTSKYQLSGNKRLGAGFIFFFSSLLGEDSHFDEHIFQMGWFNHQPEGHSESPDWGGSFP